MPCKRYSRHWSWLSHTQATTLTHTGSSSSRAKHKAVVQKAVASEFVNSRAQEFNSVQDAHKNIMRKGKQSAELIIGEVVSMYTHTGASGVKREWTAPVRSIGEPSYINILVYRQPCGNSYSSVSRAHPGCATFLRIPRTHSVFSPASARTSRADLAADASHPFVLVTLQCSFSNNLVASLNITGRVADISPAVQQLQSRKPWANTNAVNAAAVATEMADPVEDREEGSEAGDSED
ncbi:hypothetical protein BV25DRAFT_1918911 [Artomyces pyxidatus]|uniref:Uncharacterized protein n=1 Tax=Artomyces pyxidatus TaxID=48021 RepID=A0ACB8SQZ3_9AGAM|nr:hypothetical protein BV25DRAFT_1918911 [Artomyces pyxidatus]